MLNSALTPSAGPMSSQPQQPSAAQPVNVGSTWSDLGKYLCRGIYYAKKIKKGKWKGRKLHKNTRLNALKSYLFGLERNFIHGGKMNLKGGGMIEMHNNIPLNS